MQPATRDLAISVGPSWWRGARDGARTVAPLVVAIVPLAFAIGSVAATSDVPWWAAWATAPCIFSGSVQLITLRMLADGAAVVVIACSALVLSLRLGVFSAALATRFPTRSRLERLAMAVPLVDQLAVVCLERFDAGDLDEDARAAFYWGAAIVTMLVWTSAHTFGMLLPGAVPGGLSLDMAGPIVYSGLLARSLTGRDARHAAAASAAVAVAGARLPFSSSIFVALIVGALAAGSQFDRSGEGDR